MKSIILPDGTEHIPFGELADRIADALWPSNGDDDDRLKFFAARVSLETELAQAVASGVLPVKDPLTFGQHSFPIDESLNRALVMTADLRAFVGGRGLSVEFQFTDHEAGAISTSYATQADRDMQTADKLERQSKGYFTMSEVAQILADTCSLDAVALLKTMKADYREGKITVRCRDTEAPVLPNHTLRDFYDWMFPDDIRAMLKHWGWSREFPFPVANTVLGTFEVVPREFHAFSVDGMPTIDAAGYERYLAERAARNAQGRYTMREAAEVMAQAHGLDAAAFVKTRMIPAFKDGLLSVFDPVDNGPVRVRRCRDFYDIVTPQGVNAWLEADGFAAHVRWPVSVRKSANADRPVETTPILSVPQAPDTSARPTISKSALIAKYKDKWPSIVDDLKDAYDNGLAAAAKPGKRGWHEKEALAWARKNNRLKQKEKPHPLANLMSNLPGEKHIIMDD